MATMPLSVNQRQKDPGEPPDSGGAKQIQDISKEVSVGGETNRAGANPASEKPKTQSFKEKLLETKEMASTGLEKDEELVENRWYQYQKEEEEIAKCSYVYDPCPEIRVSESELATWSEPWKEALVVTLLGKRVSFKMLENKLNRDWARKGMSPVAGANVPLLPGSKVTAEPATVSGAVFNVATSVIGAGIMSLPATLKVLGVIPALVLIIVIAFLAEVSVEFLMRFTHSGETTTYAGVMRESFGPLGAVATQLCVVITNLGCLIMYLIIIADVLSGNQPEGEEVHLGVLQQWFGIQWWNSREFALFITLVLVLLPLVLYRRVESLKFSSAVSTLLAVAFVTICSVLAIVALAEGKTQTPRMFPSLDHHTSFFDLFTAVPVIVTAYTFHFNVHPIGFELAKLSDMTTAVRIALVLCAIIYFSIGLFGYLLFGDSTQSDILVNFDQNAASAVGSLLNTLVRLSYAFHVMLAFPLLNFSLRANIDEFFFPKKPLLATDSKRFVILTLVLLFFSYIAAIAIPDIWYIFQFMGSTSAVCLAFVFPASIVLRDFHGVSTRRDKIIALVMVVLAVVTSAIAISTNIYNLF